ncbi:MAG: Ig-like domain-containing protein, partial [Verrucomicrobiales bacterium]|nr:Ig-like domain-containing protein [Verrucomicrobiales bacterium]
MNYFLQITDSKGEKSLVPIGKVMNVEVNPGDDIVVMDESGNPVDVSLRPENEDLAILFENGSKAILEDFYAQEEGAEPITISLNPIEPESEAYEFNSQTGNLPNAKSFTLMRFSNTEYIEFVEQLDELSRDVLPIGNQAPASTGGGGGNEQEVAEQTIIQTTNGSGPLPSAISDSGNGIDGGPAIAINLIANDNDPVGGGLTLQAIAGVGVSPGDRVTLPSGTVVVVGASGNVSVEPGSRFQSLRVGQSETESFQYSIVDTNGNVATSQVVINVSGVNDPPTAVADEFKVGEDAPVTVDVLANDSDPDVGDTLTVTGISTPASGVATLNGDNSITFDPNGGFENLAVGETATVVVAYTLSDDAGATSNSTVTFVVEGRNDAPEADNDFSSTDQNSQLVVNTLLNDTDPDGSDTLTITGVTQPSSGLVLHNEGNVTFDPNGDFDALGVGQTELVTFQYDISDGNGGTDTATVTVTVTGVDDATETNPDFGSTNEETAVTIDVLSNDSDIDANDALSIDSVGQPANANDGVVVNNGNNLTFTPGSNFDSLAFGESATTTFEYTAIAAGSGETAIETVTVTIHGVNDNPEARDDTTRTDQDAPITIDVLTNDTDVDTSDFLIVTGVDQPSKGSATVNSENRIVFDPGNDFDSLDDGVEETVTFDYFISDGNGGTDVATVTVTVTGVEDPTNTAPDEGETDEATAIVLNVLDNDTDPDAGEVLAINSVSTPAKGSTSTNGTTITFNPNGDFEDLAVGETELVTFQYTLTTGEVETVTVTVNGLNDGPVAVNDAETTNEDSVVNIDLLGADDSVAADSDVDGDTLMVTEINGVTAGGTITLASGALVTVNANGTVDYDPNGKFENLDGGDQVTDSFTYTISDGNGGTATATATVTINGADDAMVTNPDSASTLEGTPVTIDVLNNDSDPDVDDNPLEIASISQPADTDDGVATIVGTNVTFTPGTNFESLAVGESAVTTFEYTARAPGSNETQTETVTVTVIGQNDGPVAVNDSGAVDEDATTNVDAASGVLSNDTDLDLSDGLTVTEVRTGTETGTGTGALVGNSLVGTYGTLTLDADGSYTYTADQDVTDALPVGDTVNDIFTYTV